MNANELNANIAAFPACDPPYAAGLTKREYFVAAAMAGLCADSNMTDQIPQTAIKIADAVLQALENTKPKGDQ